MSETDEQKKDRLDRLALINLHFAKKVPHNNALGIEMIDFGDGEAWLRLPYSERIVGNPQTGVIHGGAITAAMDACCGASVFMKLMRPMPIATLDLRIDYLRPAEPQLDVIAHATCYKVTRSIAFVRCIAFHEKDEADLIASAAGSFILRRKRSKPEEKPE